MSDISKIKVEDTIYNIKDTVARAANNELANSLSEEINTRQTQDTTLFNKINEEEQHRVDADIDLQEQIDAITSASDVVDVVGTKLELDEYDTSKLKDNDIIKVLQDETHNDAISYYRWNINTPVFTFIGSQGPYFTKSETEQKINEHHDNTKQDLLKSGENIKTLNGQSLLGEGNLEIKGTHVLGKTSDFSPTDRINLNNLDVGTYIIQGRTDSNSTIQNSLYFKGTYNGVTGEITFSYTGHLISSVIFVQVVNKLTDDLSTDSTIAFIEYLSYSGKTGLLSNGTKMILPDPRWGLRSGSRSSSLVEYFVTPGINQTISGVKTFTALPESSVEPTNDNQFTNKKYVDDSGVWEAGTGTNSVQTKGTGAVANGEKSVAEGLNTIANSNYSHVEGYASKTVIDPDDTETYSQAAHAEGTGTTAKGASSHTEGVGTLTKGRGSHAEGNSTSAMGGASHAEGNWTITNNLAEHAEGTFNKSNKASDTFGDAGNTLHSVGIGRSTGELQDDRKNAFEIMQNGDAYFYGVGGYDGKNPLGAKSVQDILNEYSGGSTFYLGDISSFTSSDRLDLTGLEPGTYLITRTNRDLVFYMKMTYKGNVITADLNLSSHNTINAMPVYLVVNDTLDDDVDTSKSSFLVGIIIQSDDGLSYKRLKAWITNNLISIGSSSEITACANFLITKTANQTISGKKTFTTLPESSIVPSTQYQLTNKKYVDDAIAAALNATTVEEMRAYDLNYISTHPSRPYSEEDYTQSEIDKVDNLLNILGGNDNGE